MTKKTKAADRGDGQAAHRNVRTGQPHDTDPAADTAIDRLPIPIRRRHLAACARWRSAYDHHRAIRRLIEAPS